MMLTISPDLEQRSDEWYAQRRGIVTASVVGQLVTSSTLKTANNEVSRGLVAQLAAERITGHTEPTYTNYDMWQGLLDEPVAREVYSKHFAPVTTVGFMVREWPDLGIKIGYSPDGLVGDDGLIEIKSRRQKKHLQTVLADEVPAETMAQMQAGLLVSGREWCDYVSYCGGMPMWRKRVTPDEQWFTAIFEAVIAFENAALQMVADFQKATKGLPATERMTHNEEIVI